MQRSNYYLLFAISTISILGAYVTWLVFAKAATLVLLVAGFIILLFCQLVHYRKFRQVQETQAINFQHLQSLMSLYKLLPLDHPLPVMRGWSVTPDFCNLLLSLLQEHKPRTIIEMGSGISTVVSGSFLKKINADTQIYSLEHETDYAKISQKHLDQHQLSNMAQILIAPLKPVNLNNDTFPWYDTAALANLPEIDLMVIDGPPGNLRPQSRYPALPLLISKLSPTAIVLMDDGYRERDVAKRWLKEFPEFSLEEVETERGAIILRRNAQKTLKAQPRQHVTTAV